MCVGGGGVAENWTVVGSYKCHIIGLAEHILHL